MILFTNMELFYSINERYLSVLKYLFEAQAHCLCCIHGYDSVNEVILHSMFKLVSHRHAVGSGNGPVLKALEMYSFITIINIITSWIRRVSCSSLCLSPSSSRSTYVSFSGWLIFIRL
jgi:hypothetical protein